MNSRTHHRHLRLVSVVDQKTSGTYGSFMLANPHSPNTRTSSQRITPPNASPVFVENNTGICFTPHALLSWESAKEFILMYADRLQPQRVDHTTFLRSSTKPVTIFSSIPPRIKRQPQLENTSKNSLSWPKFKPERKSK